MAQSAYETLYKVLMNINESGCRPYGMASALIVIGVSAWYPDMSFNTNLFQYNFANMKTWKNEKDLFPVLVKLWTFVILFKIQESAKKPLKSGCSSNPVSIFLNWLHSISGAH